MPNLPDPRKQPGYVAGYLAVLAVFVVLASAVTLAIGYGLVQLGYRLTPGHPLAWLFLALCGGWFWLATRGGNR